jgi:hypothetical protein
MGWKPAVQTPKRVLGIVILIITPRTNPKYAQSRIQRASQPFCTDVRKEGMKRSERKLEEPS